MKKTYCTPTLVSRGSAVEQTLQGFQFDFEIPDVLPDYMASL